MRFAVARRGHPRRATRVHMRIIDVDRRGHAGHRDPREHHPLVRQAVEPRTRAPTIGAPRAVDDRIARRDRQPAADQLDPQLALQRFRPARQLLLIGDVRLGRPLRPRRNRGIAARRDRALRRAAEHLLKQNDVGRGAPFAHRRQPLADFLQLGHAPLARRPAQPFQIIGQHRQRRGRRSPVGRHPHRRSGRRIARHHAQRRLRPARGEGERTGGNNQAPDNRSTN